jgi:hypothetical protein
MMIRAKSFSDYDVSGRLVFATVLHRTSLFPPVANIAATNRRHAMNVWVREPFAPTFWDQPPDDA